MRISAFRKEFGLKVRYHAPQTYALGEGHTIEIEEGDEALYPLAQEWKVVPRAPDDSRFGRIDTTRPVKLFTPRPYILQEFGEVDVVVCPRWRRYGPNKNWLGWSNLYRYLGDAGFSCFSGGAPDSSWTNGHCPAAWDFNRFLDATLAAMHKAKLVIATHAGLAVLSVLCGRPLLLITYGGRTAPGTQVRFAGQIGRAHV